jgi:hypothetical protein
VEQRWHLLELSLLLQTCPILTTLPRTRALIEAVRLGCGVINLLYGEGTTLSNSGRFVTLTNDLVRKHNIYLSLRRATMDLPFQRSMLLVEQRQRVLESSLMWVVAAANLPYLNKPAPSQFRHGEGEHCCLQQQSIRLHEGRGIK